MTINSLTEARNWPPTDFDSLDDADHRDINRLIADVIEFAIAQAAMASRVNQILAINDAGNGYAAADQVAALLFGNKSVGRFKPKVATPTSSVILTDNDHGGGFVAMQNTSPATVTISVSGDPTTGVSSPFMCNVYNYGTSTVQVVFSGVTNRNPASHTKVQAGRGATLFLVGTSCGFDGYTSA